MLTSPPVPNAGKAIPRKSGNPTYCPAMLSPAALMLTFWPASMFTFLSARKLKLPFVRMLILLSAYKFTSPVVPNSSHAVPNLLIA